MHPLQILQMNHNCFYCSFSPEVRFGHSHQPYRNFSSHHQIFAPGVKLRCIGTCNSPHQRHQEAYLRVEPLCLGLNEQNVRLLQSES